MWAIGLPCSVLAQGSAPTVSKETAKPPTPLSFRVSVESGLLTVPYTGKVYVLLSRRSRREPRHAQHWFGDQPVFTIEVEKWDGSRPLTVDATAMGSPVTIPELPDGTYQVQAVLRIDLDSPNPGRGSGDLYSKAREIVLDPRISGVIDLHIDQVVTQQPYAETDRVKLVEMVSSSLSKFHGRQVIIRAAVILPASFDPEGDRRYPSLYWLTGFGGDHIMARFLPRAFDRVDKEKRHDRMLIVVPDPLCYRGHSVFADSANNGPWGQALVKELIPEIERRFRGPSSGKERYVTGVSSGGWSSLWLQVNYPDEFNGCWSLVPDPVDFRDFQRIDIYAEDANMYRGKNGERRPLSHRGDEVTAWYDEFVARETVLGAGGQIHSFEAVFSPRGSDGKPMALFDRETGAIDPTVARAWRAYDIRLLIERNWQALAPKLAGKLHVYAGELDNFYLEGAVRLLKESLAKLGSDADLRIIGGAGHGPMPQFVVPMFETILANAPQDPDAKTAGAPSRGGDDSSNDGR